MPRTKKNPVTDMPIEVELVGSSQESSVFDGATKQTKNNVVPISTSSEPVADSRSWADIDTILSDVVSFI